MKNIAIFHHVYQYGDWKKIYEDQVVALQKSGLFDAADYHFVGVNGNESMPFELTDVVYHYNKFGDKTTEYCTIKALYDYCCLTDSNVLFLHTKGVTWSDFEGQDNMINVGRGPYPVSEIYKNSQKWRKYLEYFTIENWRKCVDLLSTHDVVGTEWIRSADVGGVDYRIPHYAGTIWWANSNYIKTLNANFITNNMIIGRYSTEFWIGTNNPKHYNFYTSYRNLYLDPIEYEEYWSLV